MLSKLALRNAKRCFKDYLIYLITLIIAFALIFSFNLIVFTQDIIELSSNMDNFLMMIIFISILIVFIIGILINYMNKFIFEKRSRELGTYLLLGIEKKSISRMFLIEQLILGIISLLIALVIGLFLSQVFVAIIMNIFELPYIVKFNLTYEAIGLTVIYFLSIYIVVLFRSSRRIKKMNIHDLIYFDKVNETSLFKKKIYRNIIFIIAVILGIWGLCLFHGFFKTNDDTFYFPDFLLSILLLIISIYGVSMTLPHFLMSVILKNKRLKYKHDYLFILRNITSKINTIGVTIGTITLLIALTLVSVNVSNLFTQAMSFQNNLQLPYDILVHNAYDNTDFTKALELIQDEYTIEDQAVYKIYTDHSTSFYDFTAKELQSYDSVNNYMTLSDYNHITELLGMAPITLNEDEYLINCNRLALSTLIKNKDQFALTHPNGTPMHMKDVISDHFTTAWGDYTQIIIVPDSFVTGMEVLNTNLAVNTEEETTEDFYYESASVINQKVYTTQNENGEYLYYVQNTIQVRGYYLTQNRSAITIMGFSLLYISFIFTAVTGTILAIQCLSDSTKYKFRYNLLSHLGLSKESIHHTIFKQLALTFLYPLIYPIIICISTGLSLNQLFFQVLPNDYVIWETMGLAILMFGTIYIVYFITTYIEFKNNLGIK
ncbi:FtsX-like permease family protein [Beduini massiliensis]|uniref:FtsX-like permease family protein n=1 Tax=Beduini massiliensis TaxID=1585974 RepID=UPI00059A8E1B|nr:ABC transporter permease [Beduini massiliensis]